MKNDKLMLGLNLAILAGTAFTYWKVSEVENAMRQTGMSQANALSTSINNLQVSFTQALGAIHRQDNVSSAYNELMLEGLVRAQKLPLERAREVLKARPNGLSPGWTWFDAWEVEAPAVPAPAEASPAAPDPTKASAPTAPIVDGRGPVVSP